MNKINLKPDSNQLLKCNLCDKYPLVSCDITFIPEYYIKCPNGCSGITGSNLDEIKVLWNQAMLRRIMLNPPVNLAAVVVNGEKLSLENPSVAVDKDGRLAIKIQGPTQVAHVYFEEG